jgi:hypothetical protein
VQSLLLRTSVPPLVNSFSSRQTLLPGVSLRTTPFAVYTSPALVLRTGRGLVASWYEPAVVFRASRPAKPSPAPSLAIVKAASVAFQPLVPDWKLPFGSRLLESACARGDNGSESTANKTIAPAVFPNRRER